MSLSLSIPTFISQNLGARQYERAKKGARFGVLSAVVLAELVGIFFYLFAPALISFFVSEPESVRLGASYARVTSLFYFLLAFAHATAGVMRGCGKAVVPMANMLIFWCGIRIVYVTTILHFIPQFQMIAWAYPLTWGLSDIIFAYFLLKSDWVHNFDRRSV
jgi:Na+-driven multidrug efflux pump